jgi:hypothetical protein
MNTVVKRSRRLTSAHKRLKRMEDFLKPYVNDVSARPISDRKPWVPSDHSGVSGKAPPMRQVKK